MVQVYLIIMLSLGSIEKDCVISEKDRVISEKDCVISEKDRVIREKDCVIISERNSVTVRLFILEQFRKIIISEPRYDHVILKSVL